MEWWRSGVVLQLKQLLINAPGELIIWDFVDLMHCYRLHTCSFQWG
jgi:hypothetical protein